MLKWIKSVFAWRTIRDSGVWLYKENTVTGQRKAFKYCGGYQPLDLGWLRAGNGDCKIIS